LAALKQHHPKLGEVVRVYWKKKDNIAWGMTGGFVLGVAGSGGLDEYLVLDQSIYKDTFKSNILSLGILDLHVIPMNLVEKIEKGSMRKRPPWRHEKFTGIVWVHYRSNADFIGTWQKVQKRSDCKATRPPKYSKRASEAEYQIVIKEIDTLEGVAVTVYSNGALQIKCNVGQLNKVKEWIREVIELPPEHRRLVLFETSFKYAIWDTHKEGAYPAEEIIEGLARRKKGPPVAEFKLGWTHYFFVDLPENPLEKLLPHLKPLHKFLVRKNNIAKR